MRYLTVLVIGSLLAGLPVLALAESPGNPENILGSLESAYRDGDVAALRALMAPDYEFESAGGTEGGSRLRRGPPRHALSSPRSRDRRGVDLPLAGGAGKDGRLMPRVRGQ